MRVWRKSTGPPSCSLMATAVAIVSGAVSTSRNRAPVKSKTRLAQCEACSARGDSRCTSGRPATGRTLSRWLETSVRLGTTIAWTERSSSSHIARRMSLELPKAPSAKTMTSAPTPRIAAAASVVSPRTGMPGRGLHEAGAGRGERAEHRVAEPRLATQDGCDVVDVLRASRNDHALAEVAVTAGVLDGTAQHEAPPDEQRGPDGEDQQEETAGEREAGQVATDPDQAGAEQRGLDDALVLLGPGSEDVAGVAADGEQHGQPADQQRYRTETDVVDDVVARIEEGELLPPQHRCEGGECEDQQIADGCGHRDEPGRVRRAGGCQASDGVVQQRHERVPPDTSGPGPRIAGPRKTFPHREVCPPCRLSGRKRRKREVKCLAAHDLRGQMACPAS